MKGIIYFLVLILFCSLSYATVTLTDCGNVSVSNTKYDLGNNILKANCLDECFDINASNITIDFKHFWINMTNASCSYNGNIYTHNNNNNVTLRNLNSYVNTSGSAWVNVYQKSTVGFNLYDSYLEGGYEVLFIDVNGDNNIVDNLTMYTYGAWASEHFTMWGENLTASNILLTGESYYALYMDGTGVLSLENITINNTIQALSGEIGLYSSWVNSISENVQIYNYEQGFVGSPTTSNNGLEIYGNTIYSDLNGEDFHINFTNAYFSDYGIETSYAIAPQNVFNAYVNFTSALASKDFSILGRTLILNNKNDGSTYSVYNSTLGDWTDCYQDYSCEINQTRYSQYVVYGYSSQAPYYENFLASANHFHDNDYVQFTIEEYDSNNLSYSIFSTNKTGSWVNTTHAISGTSFNDTNSPYFNSSDINISCAKYYIIDAENNTEETDIICIERYFSYLDDPPTYNNFAFNNTTPQPNQTINVSINISDDYALYAYILNITFSDYFKNETIKYLGGINYQENIIFNIPYWMQEYSNLCFQYTLYDDLINSTVTNNLCYPVSQAATLDNHYWHPKVAISGETSYTQLYDFTTYIEIDTCTKLQNMTYDLSGKYVLIGDINCYGVEWIPIGNSSNPFSGELQGEGYTITNINYTTSSSYAGMFGSIDGAGIFRLNLLDVEIHQTGSCSQTEYGHWLSNQYYGVDCTARYAGGLFGYSTAHNNISQVKVTGNVTGLLGVGLLGGWTAGDCIDTEMLNNIYTSGYVQDKAHLILGGSKFAGAGTLATPQDSRGQIVGGYKWFACVYPTLWMTDAQQVYNSFSDVVFGNSSIHDTYNLTEELTQWAPWGHSGGYTCGCTPYGGSDEKEYRETISFTHDVNYTPVIEYARNSLPLNYQVYSTVYTYYYNLSYFNTSSENKTYLRFHNKTFYKFCDDGLHTWEIISLWNQPSNNYPELFFNSYDYYYDCIYFESNVVNYPSKPVIEPIYELEASYFDLWGLLYNDLLGNFWLLLIVGLIITFYFSVYLNLSFQISILSGMLWISVVSAITKNKFIWALVVLVAGMLFYFMVSQKLRRG